jgi:hypothetical protein
MVANGSLQPVADHPGMTLPLHGSTMLVLASTTATAILVSKHGVSDVWQ